MSEPPKERSVSAERVSQDAPDEALNNGEPVKGYRLAIKPRPRKGEPETNNQSHWSKTIRKEGEPRWRTNGGSSR
jgi:hypothetical protein